MSGDYGIKTLIRAVKADFLSLVFFEVGLFAWMAIFQIAIFEWRLSMATVTYWWMMQVRPLLLRRQILRLLIHCTDRNVSWALDRRAHQFVAD